MGLSPLADNYPIFISLIKLRIADTLNSDPLITDSKIITSYKNRDYTMTSNEFGFYGLVTLTTTNDESPTMDQIQSPTKENHPSPSGPTT